MASFKGEKLEKDTKTKEVYHYHDEESGINVLSREVFKKKDEIVHYPRGFDDGPKYTNIKKFVYKGFGGSLPSTLVGVNKSFVKGYGFTRTLRPAGTYFDQKLKVSEVVIEKDGTEKFEKSTKQLILSPTGLRSLQDHLTLIYEKNNAEVDSVLLASLHSLFPATVAKPKARYIKNTIHRSIASWNESIGDFSDKDKQSIIDLFDKLSITSGFFTKDSLAKTKQLIDTKYVQGVLKEFKSLLGLVSDGNTLEKKWQRFLKANSWIFSSIFAQPIILHQDEAYVGGKSIDNKNGKVSDFLIQNSLSENISFLEIKTHKTKLVEANPYRGADVFSCSKDLVGCMVQVLNQRDNFQKNYYALLASSGKPIETINSKCVILIGSISALNKFQKRSFELFRNNSRDVEILTFDELETKITAIQELTSKSS